MKRNIKKMALAAMLAGMLGGLTGCFIQPDPTLDPLQISDGTVPFGTVQALPTNTPTPVPQSTPSPTPDTWQSSDQSTWEDWSGGSLPTTTPKTAATVAPGAQSWQTSTQDYNAGYPVLRVGSTGSDVSDLQARLTELGYYTGTIDGKYSTGTQSAVTEFQSRNGLTADGIAGPRTWALLKPYLSGELMTYVVRRGDTLSSIARRFNTTVEELLRLNPREDPDLIFVGETLLIPVSKG